MSEQQLSSDPMSEESDGRILRIAGDQWSSVEFFHSYTDGELNIEIKDSNQTWLTVAQARQLRDWLIEALT